MQVIFNKNNAAEYNQYLLRWMVSNIQEWLGNKNVVANWLNLMAHWINLIISKCENQN